MLKAPSAMAGIFGGLHSGVTENTSNLFIESAWFNPAVIRKSAKFHDLSTDASFRYERGTDPEITIPALRLVSLLITEIAGGTITGPLIDIQPVKTALRQIKFTYRRCHQLIGQDIPTAEIDRILTALGFNLVDRTNEGYTVEVPSYKSDVEGEADLVEEVLRIYGLNRIDIPEQVKACISVTPKPDRWKLAQKVSGYLTGTGFNEIATNTLTTGSYYSEAELEQAVRIVNPLSTELEYLRLQMDFSFMEAVQYNRNRKLANLQLFEFGKTYAKSANGYSEQQHLYIAVTGNLQGESWHGKADAADLYYLKARVEHIYNLLGIPASAIAETCRMQALPAAILKKFDVQQPVYIADINWDILMTLAPGSPVFRHTPVSKFPEVRRDLSLVLSKQVTYADIERIAQQAANLTCKP